MEDFELVARAGTRSYDALPQHDRDPRSLSPDRECSGSGSQSPLTLKASSISNSTLKQLDPQASKYKLPPKSYSQPPASKRIWGHIFTATAALIALGLTASTYAIVGSISSNDQFDQQGTTFCTSLSLQSYFESSSISSLLNIDMAFGNLSFGLAKFIDLVWDVGVSRGGQALLGWITYRVYTAALVRIMETHHVSYDFFATFSLSWARIWALGPLIRTFSTTLGFRRKVLLFWVALSIIWVAIWPTITNAMTGYVSASNTLVKVMNDTGYAEYSDIATTSNIGFQYFNGTNYSSTPVPMGPILLSSGPNVTLWRLLYGLVTDRNSMEGPLFNDSVITALNGNPNYNPSSPYGDAIANTPAYPFYYFRNQSYDFDYFQSPGHVQCVSNGSYQWGFSSGATVAFLVLNSLWIIGTYGVWVHLNRKSVFLRTRHLGRYRAAVDMVEAIREDLGHDTCAYTDEELDRELKKQPGVKYYVDYGEGEAPAHIGLTSRPDKGMTKLNFGELYGGMRDSSQCNNA